MMKDIGTVVLALPLGVILLCMLSEFMGWIKLQYNLRKKKHHERPIYNFYIVEGRLRDFETL